MWLVLDTKESQVNENSQNFPAGGCPSVGVCISLTGQSPSALRCPSSTRCPSLLPPRTRSPCRGLRGRPWDSVSHVCPLPGQPRKHNGRRIKPELPPRARLQLSARFSGGFFSWGSVGLVSTVLLHHTAFSPRTLAVPRVLAARRIKPGCSHGPPCVHHSAGLLQPLLDCLFMSRSAPRAFLKCLCYLRQLLLNLEDKVLVVSKRVFYF